MTYSDLDSHFNTCVDYPVYCNFKCDTAESFTRSTIQAHYDVCPRVLVSCSMAGYGCSEEVERSKLEEHLQACVPRHVGSMCKQIDELKREVENLRASLAAQQEVVQRMETNLYPSAGQFTWRIENIREKIKLAQAGDQTASVIYSPPFYSMEAGYKLSLCIYPAGDNNQGFLSLYFVVMKGQFDEILQWPFQKRVYLSLLNTRYSPTSLSRSVTCKLIHNLFFFFNCRGNQNMTKDIQPDPRLHYFYRPQNIRNVGYGYPKFIALPLILTEDSEFVENGALFLRCRIFD